MATTTLNFLADFHHVATIGATPDHGVERQAGTPEHGRAREWFRGWAEDHGMAVRVDAVGNTFALYEWVPGADFVLVGSHLDSQPLGGRFDGAYGVIAALHAAAEADARVQEGTFVPKHNLAVVDWFNEEGARFPPSIMGSSVFTGAMDLETILATRDPQGTTVREALESIGCLGRDEPPRPVAYAEVHIEQGRILERERVPIGAVDRSWHTQKLLVHVQGEQSHTGATIMSDRHDALVAAARVVLLVEQVVAEFPPESIVSSVGQLFVEPNSPIVVPREVRLVADLRAERKEDVLTAREILLRRIQDVAAEREIRIDVADFDVREIQRFPEEGLELVEKSAREAGLESLRLRTMAGHDSVPLNRIVPTVMMFVPSVGGVSHCEREFTTDEDMLAGLAMLQQVVLKLAEGQLDDVRPGEATA
jgi:N-carbamoyl-L-amino-acid hydrolase